MDRDDAFTVYKQHLAKVVGESMDRTTDLEARWAMVSRRMELWGREVQTLVEQLRESLPQQQRDQSREQVREQIHEQIQERAR